MQRHEFLRRLHRRTKPKTYLEIGVNSGASLRLSRARTIAIDPQFKIIHPLRCNLVMAKATSDDYFAKPDAFGHFRGQPTDLAFIDGMHLFEFALRDFINVERETDWTSVVVFDDMLPRNVQEAARDRETKAWTGDVYKVILTLREYRPDLVVLPVDTAPTGLLLVLAPDRNSTVLKDDYDAIAQRYVVPDPQNVPDEILTRDCAYDPEQVLAAPFWDVLEAGREGGRNDKDGAARITAAIRESLPSPDKASKGKLRSLLSR
jgi:predicted O-methyltransferase YrrM